MMDDNHVVLFGGTQSGKRRSSDVYILDLLRMVSGVELTSKFALSSCGIHVVIAWLIRYNYAGVGLLLRESEGSPAHSRKIAACTEPSVLPK